MWALFFRPGYGCFYIQGFIYGIELKPIYLLKPLWLRPCHHNSLGLGTMTSCWQLATVTDNLWGCQFVACIFIARAPLLLTEIPYINRLKQQTKSLLSDDPVKFKVAFICHLVGYRYRLSATPRGAPLRINVNVRWTPTVTSAHIQSAWKLDHGNKINALFS